MARSFKTKTKRRGIRRQKPIILIIAEGKNVTESQYFKSFQKENANYNIKILIPGHTTDPVGMQKKIDKFWQENDMSEEKGDKAYIVLDLDCDENKANLIKKLSKKSEISTFIISNPCFEVWFLLHFRYSTKEYHNSPETVKDLKNYIPNYEKNTDVAPIIENSIEKALKNAGRLEKHFDELGYDWPSNKCNPRTDVSIIIEKIRFLDI